MHRIFILKLVQINLLCLFSEREHLQSCILSKGLFGPLMFALVFLLPLHELLFWTQIKENIHFSLGFFLLTRCFGNHGFHFTFSELLSWKIHGNPILECGYIQTHTLSILCRDFSTHSHTRRSETIRSTLMQEKFIKKKKKTCWIPKWNDQNQRRFRWNIDTYINLWAHIIYVCL